jgi:hypothetical protein
LAAADKLVQELERQDAGIEDTVAPLGVNVFGFEAGHGARL